MFASAKSTFPYIVIEKSADCTEIPPLSYVVRIENIQSHNKIKYLPFHVYQNELSVFPAPSCGVLV